MDTALRHRRLPSFGWSIETAEGDVHAISRDDGTMMAVFGDLVGTQEAARSLGVQPSNFVRDWAARPDFPTPVANLSSGRVWSASAVERYAAARRAPRPGEDRMAGIAHRLVWWQPVERTLARPLDFVARVMATGTIGEILDVERRFGPRRLSEALTAAPPGVFDRRSWNYWLLALGLDRSLPLPSRRVP